MFLLIRPVASLALFAFAICVDSAVAAPGDTVVPAHRTRSGVYVPASVPPMSAGTRLGAAAGRSLKGVQAQQPLTTTFLVPLLADAQPMRR